MFEDVLLKQEQKELLAILVEASRNVSRDQRERFFFVKTFDGSTINHPGLPNGAVDGYKGDIEELGRKGLLALHYKQYSIFFDVTPEGFQYYEEMRTTSGQPLERTQQFVRDYFASGTFQREYAAAYQKWSQAESMLWAADSASQLTTIGHLCREALQEFASALAAKHQVPIEEKDKAKTIAILKAVVAQKKDQLGRSECELLDALVTYWGAVNDLVQRQEHGGQKEGKPLIWEDGRRAVFQTAVVMFEIDRSLSQRSGEVPNSVC